MESLGLIAFIIWVIVQSGKDKKKPTNSREHQPPFPPGIPIPGGESQSQEPAKSRFPSPIDFEIPPIKGAPGNNSETLEYPLEYEDSLDYEEGYESVEVNDVPWAWQPAETKTEEAIVSEPEPTSERKSRQWLPLLKNPETAREAVIYAEIFGKPKALRRR